MAFNAGAAVGKLSIKTGGWVKGLATANRSAGNFARTATRSIKGVAGAFLSLKNIMVVGIAGVAFRSVLRETVKLENALLGLSSVAKAMGFGMDEAKEAAALLASDGLLSVQEAAQGLKNLLAIEGIGLDKAVKAMNALKDASAFNRQGQLSMGEAIVGATQGLKNQLSMLVDNAGITKNLSVLQKEYAKSIGTTVGKLTELQKNLANVDGVIRESKLFDGDAAKAVNTLGGDLSRINVGWGLFLANLIDSQGPIRDITKGFANMLGEINKIGSGKFVLSGLKIVLEELQKGFNNFAKGLGPNLIEVFVVAIEGIAKTTLTTIKGVGLSVGKILLASIALSLGQGLLNIGENILKMFKNVATNVGIAFEIALTELQTSFLRTMQGIVNQLPGIFGKAFNFGGIDKAVTKITKKTATLKASFVDLGKDTLTWTDSLKAVQPIIDDIVDEAFVETQVAIKEVGVEIANTFKELGNTEAGEQVSVIFDNIKSRIKDMRDEAAASARAIIDGNLVLQGSYLSLMDVIVQMNAKIKEDVIGEGEKSIFETLFSIPDELIAASTSKMQIFAGVMKDVGKSVNASMTTMSDKVFLFMKKFSQAFALSAAAGKSFAASVGIAMKAATVALLTQITEQAALKAIFELATGFATLFTNPAESASHFTAAALFGTIAGVTGAAAASVGGGAASAAASVGGGVGGGFGASPFEPVQAREERQETISQVNITLQATGFVDEEAMENLARNHLIPIINELVLENDAVLISSNVLEDGRFVRTT